MTGLEQLIRAWVRWEQYPASKAAVTEKLAAIQALGLHSTRLHRTIAAHRRNRYDIPSAVTAACNDQHLPLEAAS